MSHPFSIIIIIFSRADPCFFLSNSGLARTFGRAAFARPASVARRSLQPSKLNGFPSLARFASTETAAGGKIHQVIGAVVDGMFLDSALVLPVGGCAKIFSTFDFIATSINNNLVIVQEHDI